MEQLAAAEEHWAPECGKMICIGVWAFGNIKQKSKGGQKQGANEPSLSKINK